MFTSLNRAFAKTPQNISLASQTARTFSACEKWFPNEPKEPVLKTAFPGPKNVQYSKDYETFGCNLIMDAFGFPLWTENSLGNYVSDVDGN